MIKIRLPFKKKPREKPEKPAEPKEAKGKPQPRPKDVFYREPEAPTSLYELWPRKPKTIFIGGSKGGAGKSFIASALAHIAACHNPGKKVFAVDLDLDNKTLSDRLTPPGAIESLIAKLMRQKTSDYLNTASVLWKGVIDRDVVIVGFNYPTTSCTGRQMKCMIRLVPAYNVVREATLKRNLQGLHYMQLQEGIRALHEYLSQGDTIAIYDGKQKSNIGIEYEPVYNYMIHNADVFVLVTEPPYLTLSRVLGPYSEVTDKLILVVNKYKPAYRDHVKILMEDALNAGIPVFIIPYDPEADKIYSQHMRPASFMLKLKASIHIGALAYYLRLIDEKSCQLSECCKVYRRILSLYKLG